MFRLNKPPGEDLTFRTFGIFIVNFISKRGKALRDHLNEVKGRALVVVLSFKLVQEAFERAPIALRSLLET